MKLSSLIAARPVSFFILLAIVVLILPAVVIPCWIHATKQIDLDVKLDTKRLRAGVQSEIEGVGKLLTSLNSSALDLARLLDDGKEFSFNKVSERLFQAFSTLPFVSQISYIALNGDFFSYHFEGNRIFASYSKSLLPSNSSKSESVKPEITYIQPVDRMKGKLYGGAVESAAYDAINTTWFQKALNSTEGYASLGDGWDGESNSLFLNSASIYGRAVLSIGFPVKALTNFLANINLFGGKMYLATAEGEVLMQGFPNSKMDLVNDSISIQEYGHAGAHAGIFQCTPPSSPMKCAGVLPINGTNFDVLCSRMEILGVKLVYALLLPHQGLASLVRKNGRLALILISTMIAVVIISVFSFVLLMIRAARREMHLCAKLIKQMESTQQAERKSMNKSLAFASTSHDIRGALAVITGLIQVSYYKVAHGSVLESNLKNMEIHTQDLLGLLNSILDMSKIEAGKMQLEEEEFNLVELLEQIADLYHSVGMMKGVDVVLDPHDGSILKFSQVRGDRARLKQVLCNLLSNAVKFTSDGHIAVRAWVQKPSLESAILASNQSGGFNNKCLSFLFSKNKETCNDMEAIAAIPQDPNSMEFVFEVEDTGKGIPKEKRKSVFEDFVQVKETTLRREKREGALGENEEKALSGTGLGLGIVQSLVRLMGGDIGIVDKQDGEQGTCFRFNMFLTLCENSAPATALAAVRSRGEIEEPQEEATRCGPYAGLTIRTMTENPGPSFRTPSPRLLSRNSSPRPEGSQVVLLIQNTGRRVILQKYINSLGINVVSAERWEQLAVLLGRSKSKQLLSPQNSSGKKESSPKLVLSSASSKDLPLSTMEWAEQKLQLSRKKGMPGFILLVIDARAGSLPQIAEIVSEFRRTIQSTCKVVWLDNPTSRNTFCDMDDDILLEPFHGSRLFRVLELLPELGGKKTISQPENVSIEFGSSSTKPLDDHLVPPQGEIQEERGDTPRLGTLRNDSILLGENLRQFPPREDLETKKLLNGKSILIVEDSTILRIVGKKKLEHHGAIVEVCENGEEALNLVRNGLRENIENGATRLLPYDCILMDCQMPVMDGCEATRLIREEEKAYGVHIPIFALTGHERGGDASREAMTAGMDFILQKPLDAKALAKAISR